MAVLPIKKYSEPVLRKRCREIPIVDAETRRILDDMAMTMYASNGIGLAGPQVGLALRIIVIDIGDGLFKLVNPKVIKREGASVLEEGCLSLPGLYVKVNRPAKVVVSLLDINGKPEMIEAKGLLSHVIQHEIDHLNGRLLIDYLPLHKRMFAKTRLLKALR